MFLLTACAEDNSHSFPMSYRATAVGTEYMFSVHPHTAGSDAATDSGSNLDGLPTASLKSSFWGSSLVLRIGTEH